MVWSTIEELLGRKSSGSEQDNLDYSLKNPPHWPRGNPYPQQLAVTSLTSRGHSVGIVLSRTKATELVINLLLSIISLKREEYILPIKHEKQILKLLDHCLLLNNIIIYVPKKRTTMRV
jgi:hypothetical protein